VSDNQIYLNLPLGDHSIHLMAKLSTLFINPNPLLSMSDSLQLQALETKNEGLNHILHSTVNTHPFELKMFNLFTFINYCNDEALVRCFTVGFIHVATGVILYNVNKLKKYLSISKSAINSNFHKYGFTEHPDRTEMKLIFTESFSKIPNCTNELKHWNVKVKKSFIWKFQGEAKILDIRNQNILKLNEQLNHIDDFSKTLVDSHIIQEALKCEKCNKPMIKQAKEASYLGYHWRCSSCNHTQSSTTDSVFTSTHISPDAGIRIIYYFAMDKTIEETVHETEITHTIVEHFFSELRCSIFLHMMLKNLSHTIGGPGKHVQIDETFISKRKYNVGRMCTSYWVIGGICEETNEMFMRYTIRRDSVVMKTLILEHVTPGTHIATDGWKAYNIIENDPALRDQYTHSTVNHKHEFVANDGTNTQQIERLWREFKQWKRRRRGFYHKDLDYYIQEFLWRREIKIMNKDPFEEINIILRR
jgi:hypothetical protein